MSSVQLVHFDSAYATYINDPYNSTGKTLTPFKAIFNTNQSFRNVSKISLVSVELPVGFVNIRKGATDTFSFILNSVTYSILPLQELDYTTIQDLITAINYALGGLVPNVTILLSTPYVYYPYRIRISFTGTTTTTSFTIIDTNLSKYILGFRAGKDVLTTDTTGVSYNATSSDWNLSFDNYINMYIPTFNSMNANMYGLVSTFKIPLNSNAGDVYYYFQNESFTQSVYITDPNFVFNNLTIIIYDRYGKDLNNHGLDYSFTLEVEYDNSY